MYLFRLRLVVCALALFVSPEILHSQMLAFPGAQGFGRFSTGGRGGTVYHVTNLNDTGAGSFRTGATTPNTTVVFDVAGVIHISNVVSVANNVTIAGQTAPGGGITLYGSRLSYSGANNSITRFIRVRMGNSSDDNDTISIASGHDMIFDHISDSWGNDETFSVSGSDPANISIQSTMISQGLQTHSAGGLIQSAGGVSIVRCFYIDNNIRNPKVKFTNEFVNCVLYDWGSQGYILGGDSSGISCANVINNYFIRGPESSGEAVTGGNLNFRIYAQSNWFDSNLNGVLDGVQLTQPDYGTVTWETQPFNYPTTNALPPLTALKLAISDVGDSWQRDIVDERMLMELTSWGTLGETISSEFETPMSGPGLLKGGVAYPDGDQDGMPDFWEQGLGMSTNAANNNDISPSGYTRLEDYCDWLADPHGVALTNTTVDIDLRQFTRGFTNASPVYTVSGASNGVATLLNDHIVQFVPTPGMIGQAGFQFTVLDADGCTITRPMNLFFTPLALPFTATWRGDEATNNWNAVGDYNWFNGQSLLYPFHPGDTVMFDDSGSTNPAVSLIGSLQPTSVTFDTSKNYVLGGSGGLNGSMTLVKAGTGIVTLKTANPFTGSTTVSNGTLLVDGSLLQSVVTVLNGATIGGNGSLGPAPILQSGATIAPGHGIGGAGTLSIANPLTENGGIINQFDLSNDPTGTVKTNDQIIITGALTVSGKNTIKVTLPDGPLLNGKYTLFKFTSFVGSLTNFNLINANGSLTNPPGEIDILVNNIRTPGNLTWVGGVAGNTWDDGITTNWLNGGAPDVFHFFDTILFDDTGALSPPVNLVGAVTPANVTVSATNNYTFAGSGKISGFGNLIKTNSGTLTMQATNDYAGVTVIGGGVLSVSWLTNSGLPSPIGASDSNSDNVLFTGGTLQYTGGNGGTDHSMTFSNATVDVTSSATTLTFSGVMAGSGTLTKIGQGRLALGGINTYSGGTLVNDGSIQLSTTTGTGGFGTGPITLNGLTNAVTLRFGSDGQTMANTLNVIGTNNFTSDPGNQVVSDVAGDGTLTVNGGTTFTFGGNMSAFSGTVKAGAIINLRFNGSTGSSNAIFDLGNTFVTNNNRVGAVTIYLGALIGGSGTLLRGAESADAPTTYVIGGKNLDTTFAGRITERVATRPANIVKEGAGVFTLTGASASTGTTTVNGGTLMVNNTTGSGLGTNTVTVNDGGTLAGTGYISGVVVVNSGGVISPGNNAIGLLTLRSNLTLNAGSMLNLEFGPGVVPNDRIWITNNLVLGGIVNLTSLNTLAAGTYTLMFYGKNLSGILPVIGTAPTGYSYTFNTNTPGQVRLIVQVQTSPFIRNIGQGSSMGVYTGTGGPTNVPYYVLATTNITLPITNWDRVATNMFDSTGAFSFTNAMTNAPQQFYRLQLP